MKLKLTLSHPNPKIVWEFLNRIAHDLPNDHKVTMSLDLTPEG